MDKRRAFRFPSEVEADCRSCDRSWTTRLVNISTSGCMIACPVEDLPENALLRLRIKGVSAIDGEIVWRHRNHAGIRFRAALHPSAMEYLAFRETERGYDTPPIATVSLSETSPSPRRATPGLHGQLVKRTWAGAEDSEPKQASAG